MHRPPPPLVVGLFVLASACVTQPYDNYFQYKGDDFVVDGYAELGNTVIAIEALNQVTGAWDEVGRANTWNPPTYRAGAWSYNSPDLYYWSTFVNLGTGATYWKPTEFAEWNAATIRVRNLGTGNTLYGGEYRSLACFLTEISPTASFMDTGWACGYRYSEIHLDGYN